MPKIVLEIHPHDAEQRGIREGDWVEVTSREGSISLRAVLTERVAARRRLYDLPSSGDWRQRRHHGELRLGDQLPRIQGDRGAGDADRAGIPSGNPPDRIIAAALLPAANDPSRAVIAGSSKLNATSGHSSPSGNGQRYRRLLRVHALTMKRP